MIQVTFNYDPDTNKVSDVKATAMASKVKAVATGSKITLNGSSLQLTQDALDLLNVKVGDRLCVRFDPQPVLVRPEIAKEPKGGNLISKSLTVSVRGKAGEQISKVGTEFEFKLKSDGYLTLVTDTEPTEVNDTEVELTQDKPVEINNDTIDDIDFLSAIEGGEEVDFTIDIKQE